MPRIARVVYVDNPHHITQRGNYKQKTFYEKEDYERYIKWIKEYSIKYHLTILSYCLMPNHVHFIAIPHKQNSLAKTFNTCHMRYSQYLNKKRKQRGHLWQGRFYSCALDEVHLYEAIRYVENNPKKAKLVKKSEEWEYSSAKAHIEQIDEEKVIELKGLEKYIKIDDWNKYLNEKIDRSTIKEIKGNTLTGRPSGKDSFIEKLERIFNKRLKALPEGRPRKKTSRCPSNISILFSEISQTLSLNILNPVLVSILHTWSDEELSVLRPNSILGLFSEYDLRIFVRVDFPCPLSE